LFKAIRYEWGNLQN